MSEQVAIWGSYHYGNFGDDLMAELFSRALLRAGHTPVVISTNPELLAHGNDTRVLPSLGSWDAPDSPRVVVGGGAMLSSDSLLEFVARPATRAVEREFKELLRFAARNDARVIPVSVGGGGTDSARILGSRRRFFAGPWAPVGSVRLEGDRELVMRQFSKNYPAYADVLFDTPSFLPVDRGPSASDIPRIGVNLHERRAAAVVAALKAAGMGDSLVAITTHSSAFNAHYEWRGDGRSELVYEDLGEFTSELASLDVLVSDKLHVGLVAATYGVPFVSYQPKAKTRALHNQLSLDHAVIDDAEQVASVVRGIAAGTSPIHTLRDRVDAEGLNEQGRQHIELMLKEIG